jgi:hypothetical protein
MALRWQGPRYAELAAAAQEITIRMEHVSECESLASAVFRKEVGLRLHDFSERLAQFCEGRLIFESTETWRTVYEGVLKGCQPQRYLSVALIRTDDYWRDTPGENSLQFNYELIDGDFHVHRVFVIDEFFWPRTARTPSAELFRWIQGQRQRGVEVSLVRLSELEDEPTLVSDMGIYGSDAVGWQQTDFEGRTVRYEISFDRNAVAEAEQRWHQLLLFAKPFDAIVVVD